MSRCWTSAGRSSRLGPPDAESELFADSLVSGDVGTAACRTRRVEKSSELLRRRRLPAKGAKPLGDSQLRDRASEVVLGASGFFNGSRLATSRISVMGSFMSWIKHQPEPASNDVKTHKMSLPDSSFLDVFVVD